MLINRAFVTTIRTNKEEGNDCECLAEPEERKHFTEESILTVAAKKVEEITLVPLVFSSSRRVFRPVPPSRRNAELSRLIFRLCRIPRWPAAGSLLAFSQALFLIT